MSEEEKREQAPGLHMIPVGTPLMTEIASEPDGPRRMLALRHAVGLGRPGLWGDRPRNPSTLMLVHDQGEWIEAIAAGRPGSSLEWLARHSRPVKLLAPPSWREEAIAVLGNCRSGRILTLEMGKQTTTTERVHATRLNASHAPMFEAFAPSWAWRSWGSASVMLAGSAAFGVMDRDKLTAAAWVMETDGSSDAVGVFVDPFYRRLELGKAVAGSLAGWTMKQGRRPVWSVVEENEPSRRLAGAIGFNRQVGDEELLWFGKS